MSSRDDRIATNYFNEVGKEDQPTPEEEHEMFAQFLVAKQQAKKGRKTLKTEERRLLRLSPGKTRNAVQAKCELLRATIANWDRKIARLNDELPKGYLRFVCKEARRRTRDPQLLKDLISEGNVGLLDAVKRFDVSVKVRFLTYAAYWINVRMQEFLSRDSVVHIPSHTRKANRRQRRKEEADMAQGLVSQTTFEEPMSSGLDPETLAAEQEAISQENKVLEYMHEAGLSRCEKAILMYTYGFRGREPKSFDEIAHHLYTLDGSTFLPENIREIRDLASSKLQSHMNDLGVSSYAEAI